MSKPYLIIKNLLHEKINQKPKYIYIYIRMDTYIILSSEQTHDKKKSKPRNQETKKSSPGLGSFHNERRHSTRYSLIDRHFRSHEHRNLWSRFFVSSFPSPRTHFSSLIGGWWREEENRGNFSSQFLDSRSNLPSPFPSLPEMEKFLCQRTERPMNTNQRGGRLFNYKPSSTGVSNFPRRLPSIFETAEAGGGGGGGGRRSGINDRLRNFSGKVRRVSAQHGWMDDV